MEKKTQLIAVMSLFLASIYGWQYFENEQLKEEISGLKSSLEQCKNEPRQLLEQAKAFFESKNYKGVDGIGRELSNKYLGTPEQLESKAIVEQSRAFILEAAKEKIKVEAENRAKKEIEQDADKDKKSKEAMAALGNLAKKTDDINGFTYFRHKNAPSGVKDGLIPYIVADDKDGKNPSLMLETTYKGSDWIFVKSYRIKADDAVYDIDFDYNDVKRDNSAGTVWEWTVQPIRDDKIQMLKQIAKSKKAVIRRTGTTYYDDYEITKTEKKIISDVVLAYEHLSAK